MYLFWWYLLNKPIFFLQTSKPAFWNTMKLHDGFWNPVKPNEIWVVVTTVWMQPLCVSLAFKIEIRCWLFLSIYYMVWPPRNSNESFLSLKRWISNIVKIYSILYLKLSSLGTQIFQYFTDWTCGSKATEVWNFKVIANEVWNGRERSGLHKIP
jgi:hypothetical protein